MKTKKLLPYGLSLLTAATALLSVTSSVLAADKKPNILVIWGDDIGTWNISANNKGMMGYKTPNIDRIAREGVAFTDYYAQQSCTAGRSAFISGSVPVRNGMTKVGLPGAKEGWKAVDCTMATVLKGQGYATGHFGKNHWTSICPPCTASTSSSAASTISTPKKSRRTSTTRRTRPS
jgi:arylsulfatase A-like enzyme